MTGYRVPDPRCMRPYLGKIIHIGHLPLNLSLSAFYNVETPQYGPDWQLRFTVQMLFPR